MKKMSRRNSRAPVQERILPDDACPTCGTMMKEARGRMKLPINGEEITVPSASHLKCPKCGEIVLRFQEAKRLHEDAVAIYRRKYGLLSADEIRAVRERFNLNQANLAR